MQIEISRFCVDPSFDKPTKIHIYMSYASFSHLFTFCKRLLFPSSYFTHALFFTFRTFKELQRAAQRPKELRKSYGATLTIFGSERATVTPKELRLVTLALFLQPASRRQRCDSRGLQLCKDFL